MSAIDNAFIRAYTTDATPLAPTTVASGQRDRTAASSAAAAKAEIPRAIERGPVAGTLAEKPNRPHFKQSAARANTQNSVIPAPHINLVSFAHSVTTLDPPIPNAPIPVRVDPPAVARYMPHTISTSAAAPAASAPATRDELDERPSTEAAAARSVTEHAQQRPAFEVDRLAWPETCDALIARIGEQVDELGQELMAEAALGRKVIAVSGSSHDSGETTLALVLARRLAATGAKVALVDADFAAPQLAGRLGLVIGIGWETVLALPEQTSLWETMVESLEDRLTIVPLAARSRLNISGEIAARLADCLRELRGAFDIVVVDAGPVSSDLQTSWLAKESNGVDAAILVSDVRSIAADRLVAVSRRLLDANVAPLGIAENYCASS